MIELNTPRAIARIYPGFFVDDTAVIDAPWAIGSGTRIWHYTHVMAGARIGRDCVIGQGCFVASTAVIGNGCHIQNNVSIYDGVHLEDDVFVGPSAVFTNVKRPRASRSQKESYAKTYVCKGATIGANATILCGVIIGEYAMIGAGAVITRDVEAYAVMCGPAALMMGKVKD